VSAPTAKVRAQMLDRDGRHCVVCPATAALEAQHRRAVGMGGSNVRPGITDLLTACSTHNAAFEAGMQGTALLNGWKVRRWVQDPGRVPVFYEFEGWHVLALDGTRRRITADLAEVMMREVYGLAWARGGVL
jgi:hypothetical protein